MFCNGLRLSTSNKENNDDDDDGFNYTLFLDRFLYLFSGGLWQKWLSSSEHIPPLPDGCQEGLQIPIPIILKGSLSLDPADAKVIPGKIS